MDNQHRKITGYRELTQDEIDAINEVKCAGQYLENVRDKLAALPAIDRRWLDMGTADLQTGLMAFTRAIARPTTF